MLKSMLIVLVVLCAYPVVLYAHPDPYRVPFTGEDIAAIEDISLCATDHSIYVAYTPPDAQETVITQLQPDLTEIRTTRLHIVSPSIKAYQNIYLAGISGESIVVYVLSHELETIDHFTFEVEEPIDVCILPCEHGLYISYAHRFLEDRLLRQDVFVKKFDFSFSEIATTRLTSWYYWMEPCMTLYNDKIIISYSFTSLQPFLGRYLVITTLDKDLEIIKEVIYPKEHKPDTIVGKNVTQPDITGIDSGILLVFRMTDEDFSTNKLTWEGMQTIVPGNIYAVLLSEDLTIKEEISITKDSKEEYEPTVISAFDRVYLAHYVSTQKKKYLEVVYADTVYELAETFPVQRTWWPYLVGAGVIVIVAGWYVYSKKS
ncbi:MAG: hypothetical protein PVF58_16515 [Candidatus Methanofastidiosia archaeon]|jgi:hypothetical protein